MKKVIRVFFCYAIIFALLFSATVISHAAIIGDDYPWKTNSGGSDDWGYVVRNCTSFVAWRLHSQNGFSMPRGIGNAKVWGGYAQTKGYAVDGNPVVGSIAWSSSGEYGHVAWVAEVNGNNIVIEEYNARIKTDANPSGAGLVYNRRTVSKSDFSGFIHFKDIGGIITPPSTAPEKPIVTSNKSSYEPNECVTFTWNACANADWYDFNLQEIGGSGRSYYYDSSIVGKKTVLSFSNGIPAGSWQAQVVACNSRNGLQTNPSDYTYFTCTVPAPTTYTVTYNANGGIDAPPSQTKIKDISLKLSNTKPTRAGYEFLGWATSSNATTAQYQSGGSYTANSNITLFAVWRVITYTITFEASGATNVPAAQTKTRNIDLAISNTRPIKNGYTFSHWYSINNTSEEYRPEEIYKKNSDVTLRAYFVPDGSLLQDGIYSYIVDSSGVILCGVNTTASSVSIPAVLGGKSVVSIANGAFQESKNLVTITLPSSVRNIGRLSSTGWSDGVYSYGTLEFTNDCEFIGLEALKTINVDNSNSAFSSVNGVLFNKDKTVLCYYPRGKTETSYSIPSSVKEIGRGAFANALNVQIIIIPSGVISVFPYAFSGCKNLSQVNLPTSVKNIYEYAFQKCTSLTTVVIPEGVTFIGTCAYQNCSKLSSIIFPNTLDRINQSAFSGCVELTSVNLKNVTRIRDAAFRNTGLRTVDIPASVTQIEAGAFACCKQLESINVVANNNAFSSNSGVLFNKDSSELLQYPAGKQGDMFIVPQNVSEIAAVAFDGCVNLVSVVLPEGISKLNINTFTNCPRLTHVVVPESMKRLDHSWLFLNCPSIEYFTIPETVEYAERAHSEMTKAIVVLGKTTQISESLAYLPYLATTYVFPIYCYPDSVAHQYTVANQMPFVLLTASNTYSISFDANGGTGAPKNQVKVKGIPLYLPITEPKRSGYTFLGWSTSKVALSAEYKLDDGFYRDEATTLYAVWEKDSLSSYVLTYNAVGGIDAPAAQIAFGEAGLAIDTTVPVRDGYIFQGWMTLDDNPSMFSPGMVLQIAADTMLYAVWKANTYTIRYNANGGTGTMENSTHTYDIAEGLSANAYSKTGHAFAGWAYDPDGEAAFDNGESVKNLTSQNGATVEFYAVWQAVPPATYPVTVANGSGGGNFAAGATMTITASPAPSGQQFKEWSITPTVTFTNGTSKTSPTAKFTMPAAAITASAVYENITSEPYTITYNANGGNGAPAAQSKTQGVSLTLSATIPTRTGYIFKGWATNSNATSAQYQAGGQYAADASATLYAVWETEAVTPPNPPTTNPIKYIFTTKYKATFINWLLFFIGFGWLWMWF